MAKERNVRTFEDDVAAHEGYVYTTSDKLSCRLSNGRMTRAICELGSFEGKRVLDIGCGDGTYTLDLLEAGAREVRGIDAAAGAIERARTKFADRPELSFDVVDIYALEEPDELWDVAVVRGILHHLYEVEKAIERVARVAREVIVLEPNGYNPVLKVIEKVSPYHVQHEEKSYPPRNLDRWFEDCGGRVERSLYVGLVPMFCPDFLARIGRACEPLVEGIPLLRAIVCGQYVQRIRTSPVGPR